MTCWPTIGAKVVSNAMMNASTSRRSWSLAKLKTVARKKRKTVSVLPS